MDTFCNTMGIDFLGIIFKIFFVGRFKILSTLLYILMGWIVVFVFKDLKNALSPVSLNLLIIGGVIYTVGTIFYAMKKLKFAHSIWHIFVIGGSVLNYLSIYNIIHT